MTQRHSKTFTAALTAALAGSIAALAQAQPAPQLAEPDKPALTKPGNESAAPSNSDAAQPENPDAPKEPLSKQLKESEGVIEPPAGIDPEIKKPTPEVNSKMPVITPPGEPGGDQSVQPK